MRAPGGIVTDTQSASDALPALHAAAHEYVMYQVANAPIREYPYPHLYIDSIFPADFYAAVRANWPSADQLVSLADTGRVPDGAYSERFIMPLGSPLVDALPEPKKTFWKDAAAWMLQGTFLNGMLGRFESQLKKRFGAALGEVEFVPEVLVVRDHTNYRLGPHTDSPRKVLSVLFYCPDDESMKHLGTSIYAPVDPAFRCDGGPHYPFENFRRIATMEYKPNALFGFFKTDHSFHGVDPIRDEQVQRDVLLYDVRVVNGREGRTAKSANPSSGFGLRMLARLLGSKNK